MHNRRPRIESEVPTASPEEVKRPGLTVLASSCAAGTCPTIYREGDDAVIVQGYPVAAAEVGVAVPAGEILVRIPAELLARVVVGRS